MSARSKYIAFFIVTFALLVSGCKTLPQPTNVHNRDSVRVEVRHDSVYIYQHDSIFRDRWRDGDTVYITTEKWLTRYKDKYVAVHDTISVSATDTIYQTIEIEKQSSSFWKGSGIAFWILLGLLAIGCTIGLIIKFAK